MQQIRRTLRHGRDDKRQSSGPALHSVLRIQKRDLDKYSDPQNDALEQLAEQVAGSLF